MAKPNKTDEPSCDKSHTHYSLLLLTSEDRSDLVAKILKQRAI